MRPNEKGNDESTTSHVDGAVHNVSDQELSPGCLVALERRVNQDVVVHPLDVELRAWRPGPRARER